MRKQNQLHDNQSLTLIKYSLCVAVSEIIPIYFICVVKVTRTVRRASNNNVTVLNSGHKFCKFCRIKDSSMTAFRCSFSCVLFRLNLNNPESCSCLHCSVTTVFGSSCVLRPFPYWFVLLIKTQVTVSRLTPYFPLFYLICDESNDMNSYASPRSRIMTITSSAIATPITVMTITCKCPKACG